jgi:serine/threonine protein kinase
MVAIKFLRPDIAANQTHRKRFKKEAQACASLNHPNIATIFDFVELDDDVFFVMEFVDGVDLRDLLLQTELLSIAHVIQYSQQICSGLKAAHDKGIIHRDIKPENIRITPQDQIKIMDFGIAKLPGYTQLTQEGSSIGTIAYMSPEQSRGNPVDQRTDIWSFGAMLYEMLSGESPFKGHYDEAVIYSILNEDPQSLNSYRKNIPEYLERMVTKALQKNPDDRYQTIAVLLADFEPKDTREARSGTEKKRESILFSAKNFRWIFLAVILAVIVVLIGFQGDQLINNEKITNTTTVQDNHSLIIQDLINSPDTPTFLDRLTELKNSMRIAVGNADDFSSHEGCYIFVLGINRIEAVFQYHSNRFVDISTRESIETLADRYSGKTSIWVRDLSH